MDIFDENDLKSLSNLRKTNKYLKEFFENEFNFYNSLDDSVGYYPIILFFEHKKGSMRCYVYINKDENSVKIDYLDKTNNSKFKNKFNNDYLLNKVRNLDSRLVISYLEENFLQSGD